MCLPRTFLACLAINDGRVFMPTRLRIGGEHLRGMLLLLRRLLPLVDAAADDRRRSVFMRMTLNRRLPVSVHEL
jgi:hypothetical protein